MAYKQRWGVSRTNYQGKTSPMNMEDMPHIERLQKQYAENKIRASEESAN